MFLDTGTAWLLGYDLMSETIVYEVANNRLILFVDIIGSFLMFYLAGRIFSKYVPGKEKKYGLILGIILFITYTLLFNFSNSIWFTPSWYFIIILVGIIPAIYYGTLSKVNA